MKKTKFDAELYNKLGINGLILFSINSVIEGGKECTFELLIKECFTDFPQVFAFKSHPQWPDSRKLDRTLRSLRNQNLIIGDPKTYFNLTKAGKKVAEDINKNFQQRKLFK